MPNDILDEKQETEIAITLQYRHIKELSKLAYEAEEKREQNLIQQASQMQTTFSFMITAIFVAAPIFIDFFGTQSKNYFYTMIFVCTVFLLVSLFLASISQWRWKTKSFPDIVQIKDAVRDDPNWKEMCHEYSQIDQYVNLVGTIQLEKAKLNNRRVGLIMASMICLYLSIAILIICLAFATFIF